MNPTPGKRALGAAFFKTAFIIATVALAAVLVVLAFTASVAKEPVWRLVAFAMTAHLFYGLALFFAWKAQAAIRGVWIVLGLSLALRLLTVGAPPTFSDDVYRYIWDGRMLLNGINPYSHAPDDAKLEGLRDKNWSNINHKTLKTIYPPVGQVFFGAVALVCPRPVGFKVASALADVGVVFMVLVLAGGATKKSTMAALAYGLNPLACMETGMSGHLDPFAVLLTLVALYFLVKNRSLLFSALVGLGAGIKLAPVLALPISRKRRIASWSLALGLIIAVYLPFSSAGLGMVETLDAFARRWEGNAGLFAVVNSAASSLIEWSAGADGPDAIVHLSFLDGPAAALNGTFFSLHKDGGFNPEAPGAFAVGDLSLAMAKIILGLALAAVIITVSLKRMEPLRAAAWIFGALIVVTPVAHPWYLLWILPLAAVLGAWPWMVLAALATLAYLPLDTWWARQVWEAPVWIPIVEWGAFGAAGAVYFLYRFRSEKKEFTRAVSSSKRI